MINNLTKPENRFFWIVLGICIKIFLAAIVQSYQPGTFSWYNMSGDATEYLSIAENLIYNQSYEDLSGNYASRMPSYPIVLALFISIFGQNLGLSLLVFLQLFVSGASVYYLSRIAQKVFITNYSFFIAFFTYGFSSLISYYDTYIITESLAISSLILSIYLIIKYKERNKSVYIFIAGLLLTYAIFSRPFLMPILPICIIYLISNRVFGVNRILKTTIIFSSVFIIAESVWILRNFNKTARFIPFQENTYAGINTNLNPYLASWNWMNAIGEDVLWWRTGSFGSYFYAREEKFTPKTFNYKPHMLASGYDEQDLENIRELYNRYQNDQINIQEKDSLSIIIVEKFENYTSNYKKERPIQYHLFSRLRILKHAFFHSGPPLPFSLTLQLPFLPLTLKIVNIILYYFFLFFGIIGLGYSIIKLWKKQEVILLSLIPIMIIFILGVYFRYTEFRLYLPIFPFLTIFSVYIIEKIISFNRKNNHFV